MFGDWNSFIRDRILALVMYSMYFIGFLTVNTESHGPASPGLGHVATTEASPGNREAGIRAGERRTFAPLVSDHAIILFTYLEAPNPQFQL